MAPTRRRIALTLALSLAALSLSACASMTPESGPQPTPASSAPSPSSEPTSTALTAPVPPVAGGCNGLVGDSRLTAAVGAVKMVSLTSEPWSIGFETIGGLSCAIDAERFSGEVFAVPTEAVTPQVAAEFADPGCRRVYDAIECTASTTTDRLWVLAMAAAPESMANQPPPPDLISTLEAAATIFSEGQPAGVTPSESSWASSIDCDAVETALDPSAVLGSGEIHAARYQEGRGPLDRYLADAWSTSPRCDWMQLTDWQEIGFVALPDADWAWQRLSAGGAPATVGGRPAIIRDNQGRREVLVSDGVNLLVVSSVNLSDAETISAAESVLSELTKSA